MMNFALKMMFRLPLELQESINAGGKPPPPAPPPPPPDWEPGLSLPKDLAQSIKVAGADTDTDSVLKKAPPPTPLISQCVSDLLGKRVIVLPPIEDDDASSIESSPFEPAHNVIDESSRHSLICRGVSLTVQCRLFGVVLKLMNFALKLMNSVLK